MTSLERLSCFGSRDLMFNAGIVEWMDDFGPTDPWGTPGGSTRSVTGATSAAW